MVGKIKGSPTTEKKKMKAGLNRVFLPARFGLVRRSGRIAKKALSRFKNDSQTPIILDDNGDEVAVAGRKIKMLCWTRRKHFKENMDAVLEMTESKSIQGVSLVQIPMHYSDHFYLLSFNMITFEIVLIDNIDSTEDFEIRYHGWPEKMRDAFSWYVKSVSPVAAAKLLASKPTVLDIPWKTTLNGIDCGVFLMRHMETYMGSLKEWRCGFSPEFNSKGELSGKQCRELDDLRRKYIAKILLCDINRSKHVVEAGVRRYLQLGENYRRQLDGRAYKKILNRLNSL